MLFACYACFLGSFEYEKQSICLNGHVSSCVDGVPLLNAFKGEIVKLLELLVYHCGKLSFEVSRINPLILGQVDCDAGKLEGIVGCWDDFRTTFNASRNDSLLCRQVTTADKNFYDHRQVSITGKKINYFLYGHLFTLERLINGLVD